MLEQVYRYYHKLPDHIGKYRLSRFIEKRFFSKELEVTTNFGFKVIVDLLDSVERKVFFEGSYEELTLQFMKSNLNQGEIIVCSGSAYGYHLLVGCQQIGETGFAVGIDPQPSSLYRTFLNLEKNGFRGRFSLLNAALTMESGKFIPFSSPNKDNRGSSSIPARTSRSYKDYYSVSTTFDEVMNSLEIDQVNLLVLDVEGYEDIVINSLSKVLPEIIIFEIHPYFIKNTGLNPKNVFNNLKARGYKIADLRGQEIKEYNESILENNLVAYQEDRKVNWQ